jgi:hypothetical protein
MPIPQNSQAQLRVLWSGKKQNARRVAWVEHRSTNIRSKKYLAFASFFTRSSVIVIWNCYTPRRPDLQLCVMDFFVESLHALEKGFSSEMAKVLKSENRESEIYNGS